MRATATKRKRRPIPSNVDVLTAVADMRRQGVHPDDIARRLRISRATYYRCVAAVEAAARNALRPADDD